MFYFERIPQIRSLFITYIYIFIHIYKATWQHGYNFKQRLRKAFKSSAYVLLVTPYTMGFSSGFNASVIMPIHSHEMQSGFIILMKIVEIIGSHVQSLANRSAQIVFAITLLLRLTCRIC